MRLAVQRRGLQAAKAALRSAHQTVRRAAACRLSCAPSLPSQQNVRVLTYCLCLWPAPTAPCPSPSVLFVVGGAPWQRASIVEHTFGAPAEQQFRMFSRPTSTSVGAERQSQACALARAHARPQGKAPANTTHTPTGAQARLCAGTPVRSTAAARAGRDQGAEQGVTVELPPALQRRAMSVYTLGVSTQAYAGSQSTSMHVAAKCGMEARGAHLRREALAGVKAVCGRRALSGGSSSSGGGGGGPGGGGELTLKERFKVMAQDYGKVIMVRDDWVGGCVGPWSCPRAYTHTHTHTHTHARTRTPTRTHIRCHTRQSGRGPCWARGL